MALSDPTRRDILVASAAIPIAVAGQHAPLTLRELRMLAMAATPPEVWVGRQHEYKQDPNRIVDEGTEEHRITIDLEERGFIERTATPWREDMEWFVTATPKGIEELRKHGIV